MVRLWVCLCGTTYAGCLTTCPHCGVRAGRASIDAVPIHQAEEPDASIEGDAEQVSAVQVPSPLSMTIAEAIGWLADDGRTDGERAEFIDLESRARRPRTTITTWTHTPPEATCP